MSLRLRCNRLVAKTGSDCTMPERRTNRHPSAVEFGSLTEFAKGLLQRNPSLIPPREPPTPRVRVGNTILPPAPGEAANNEAVVALRGGRPASARSRESAAPSSAPATVPPVSVWSERPQRRRRQSERAQRIFRSTRGQASVRLGVGRGASGNGVCRRVRRATCRRARQRLGRLGQTRHLFPRRRGHQEQRRQAVRRR